jgi:response regulator NasT
MFARDADAATIREVMRAGVSAYVVDGLDPARVKSIIDVACARFEEFQRLRAALAEANLKLAERKVVERAKGILMKARGVSEEDAYRALRRMAMDRNRRLVDVAQAVVDTAELLG